jgi:hypothetical protein
MDYTTGTFLFFEEKNIQYIQDYILGIYNPVESHVWYMHIRPEFTRVVN